MCRPVTQGILLDSRSKHKHTATCITCLDDHAIGGRFRLPRERVDCHGIKVVGRIIHALMALTPGTKLGPYQILALIGAGGMGEVYRACDTRLDCTVAVKTLIHRHSTDQDLRRRFEREARLISGLSHPHICTLFDIGRDGETDYLVMEYLEGETLAHRLLRGSLPPDQTLQYGVQITDALEQAHRQGVTHRDLKPGNIMLTKSGAKLLDFGLKNDYCGALLGGRHTYQAFQQGERPNR